MILNCDCRDGLAWLESDSLDAVITDPPYEIGMMGKGWDSTGIAFSRDLWREVLRVLKPGAHMLVFGATRTYHRVAVAIEDAGFEVRDCLMWVYSSGFPKSRNLGGDWQGWGTALKPAYEPILLARKPLFATVEENVNIFGTGAINIDGCRVPDVNGRWPANLIHDGSAEVVDLFPEVKGQVGMKKLDGGFRFIEKGDLKTVQQFQTGVTDFGSAARFFYCSKATAKDRDEGLDDFDTRPAGGMKGRNDGSLGSVTKRRNHHPTVKPTALLRYLAKMIVPPSGTVLDPFAGSGSTGKAAVLEGFNFVGFELSDEYAAIATARIEAARQGV